MSDTQTKTVKVTQTGSPIGRKPGQRETLIGLGLVLFVVSFLFQAAANLWLNRLQRVMGQH